MLACNHHSPSRLRGRREITFAVLAVAASSFALLQSLIVPVLATIQVEFDTSQTTVTWVLTAYLLSASICTPLLGRIGDVVGKTRMLVDRAWSCSPSAPWPRRSRRASAG